jgi:hypothetical protein
MTMFKIHNPRKWEAESEYLPAKKPAWPAEEDIVDPDLVPPLQRVYYSPWGGVWLRKGWDFEGGK